MTLYAFRCAAAQHEVEMFWPLGEAPAFVECPDHKSRAARLMARGAFATVPGGHNSEYGPKQ